MMRSSSALAVVVLALIQQFPRAVAGEEFAIAKGPSLWHCWHATGTGRHAPIVMTSPTPIIAMLAHAAAFPCVCVFGRGEGGTWWGTTIMADVDVCVCDPQAN